MPSRRAESLRWNAAEIAKIMARKGIPHREALAREIKQPATTVRRSFNEDWDGEATGPIVVALARTFRAPLHKLLRDPREDGER